MFSTDTVSSPERKSSSSHHIIMMLIVNVIIPYGCYAWAKASHASDIVALCAAAIAPLLAMLASLRRTRHVNFIALLVIAGLVFEMILTSLGGDTRLFLIRESFFTVIIAIVCFVSLFLARPLMFYVIRSVVAGNDPGHIARYDQSWQDPSARHAHRVITIVWGIIYIVDFLVRLLLIFTLSTATVASVAPLVTGGLTGVAILWTFVYLDRARKVGRAAQVDTAPVAK